ncbi:MAG: hypothetical protein HRT88_08745 [Lentisphaeraceae bacterium]|nr:hypothetical protein [Lentisphaeraceae bacterium]
MNQTEKKNLRTIEIKELIVPFAIEYMDEEAYACSLKLLNKLARKRVVDITKGKKEIWAASIIYVIARLNFLFDKEQDYWMTADEIAGFFCGSKSTISQKATKIEKGCSIGMCDPEFTRARLAGQFQFVQLPSGFIVKLDSEAPEEYAASPEFPEEVEAYELFNEAQKNGQLKPPRKIAWEAEKAAKAEVKRIAQEKSEEEKRILRGEKERLAVEEAERKRIEFEIAQPGLFDDW